MLTKLQPGSEHPHGLSDDTSIVVHGRTNRSSFAFHGYPWLIHRLTYRRTNHENMHVRGYRRATITTPFDMAVLNDLDRLHLVGDVIDRAPGPRRRRETSPARQTDRARTPPANTGEDMPEIATGNGKRNERGRAVRAANVTKRSVFKALTSSRAEALADARAEARKKCAAIRNCCGA